MGHFLLTNLLLDTIKKSAPSRIIFLVNLDYRKGIINLADLNLEANYNKSQAFRQSQLANMLLVLELSDRLKGLGVTCNAVYPGIVGGTGWIKWNWAKLG
jgi:NAD(P)-dependent dehydrogenase (short-subunit alcohol dehydrogenase family)